MKQVGTQYGRSRVCSLGPDFRISGLWTLPSPALFPPFQARNRLSQLVCPPPPAAQFLDQVDSGLIVLACPSLDHSEMGELVQFTASRQPLRQVEGLVRPPLVLVLDSLLPFP